MSYSNSTDLEIKILSDFHKVKNVLNSICIFYQEDFLLENLVFVTVDDISKLIPISNYIEIIEEEYAYQ